MYIEEMMIERIENNRSFTTLLKSDENDMMVMSFRPGFDNTDIIPGFGMRRPFDISFGSYEDESDGPCMPEDLRVIDELHILRIHWGNITFKNEETAAIYWLCLPKNAVVVRINRVSPKEPGEYQIYKDKELRKLWIFCRLHSSVGNNIDFIVSYKIDSDDFNNV